MEPFVSPDWFWHGMHPFHDQGGPEAVARVFWTPLKNALTPQRSPDIFLAGRNEIDGFQSTWVVEMGHLMGLFDRPWLGIRHNLRIVMLRYCEFNKVENGKIFETAMFCDIPHLTMQAGQNRVVANPSFLLRILLAARLLCKDGFAICETWATMMHGQITTDKRCRR